VKARGAKSTRAATKTKQLLYDLRAAGHGSRLREGGRVSYVATWGDKDDCNVDAIRSENFNVERLPRALKPCPLRTAMAHGGERERSEKWAGTHVIGVELRVPVSHCIVDHLAELWEVL
jgi:hypothetical protein